MLQIDHLLFFHELQVPRVFFAGRRGKIDDPLSGEAKSVAAGFSTTSHCVGMATFLNDTTDNPDLEIVIETAPHAAIPVQVSTRARH